MICGAWNPKKICPPHLSAVATLHWEIQKVIFNNTRRHSDYWRNKTNCNRHCDLAHDIWKISPHYVAGFHLPKIINIGKFWHSYSKNKKENIFLGHNVHVYVMAFIYSPYSHQIAYIWSYVTTKTSLLSRSIPDKTIRWSNWHLYESFLVTLAASSEKRNVTVWRPSVRLSACLSPWCAKRKFRSFCPRAEIKLFYCA